MGKIIPLPDIEYKHWCNTNKELLEEMLRTCKVNPIFLQKREFLERYVNEHGFEIE